MGQTVGVNAHAFLWDNGRVTDLGTVFGGPAATATAISNRGQIVGSATPRAQDGPSSRGFFWDNGSASEVGPLPGFDICAPSDVNDEGQVVGICRDFGEVTVDRGFIWHKGRIVDLNLLIETQSGLAIHWGKAIDELGRIAAIGQLNGGAVSLLLLPQPLAGDANSDCLINVLDLGTLLGDWGKQGSPADFDDDGVVGPSDLIILVSNWSN
jgi:probable HAF family extracellular repeat protein